MSRTKGAVGKHPKAPPILECPECCWSEEGQLAQFVVYRARVSVRNHSLVRLICGWCCHEFESASPAAIRLWHREHGEQT